ncbi:hypothetical protein AHAS_Ahas07G0113400 [Arachis hypogaea]
MSIITVQLIEIPSFDLEASSNDVLPLQYYTNENQISGLWSSQCWCLGWAFVDSILHRLAPLWVDARGLGFTWNYILQGMKRRARSERRVGRQREASFRSRGEQDFHSGEEALMPMSNMVTTQGRDARKLIGGEIHRWSWKKRMVVDILPLKMLSTVRQRSDQSRSSLQRQATRKVHLELFLTFYADGI